MPPEVLSHHQPNPRKRGREKEERREMEGGASYGSFNGGQGVNSGNNLNSAAAAAASGSESVQGQQATAAAQPPAIREQDRFMPIANVIRIMRKVLPTHAKISDDAKETIQECVSEYISFITSEANERCQREQRKTITAEDVLWAMSKLGFDDYIEPLSVYLHRYRELEGDHRGSIRGDPLPILKHRQQHQHHHHHHHHEAQQLYVTAQPHAPPPPPQQSYMGPPQHGMHPQYGGMYGDGMGGYYGMYGGGGGGGGGGDHGHGGGASASMAPNNFEHHPYAYK